MYLILAKNQGCKAWKLLITYKGMNHILFKKFHPIFLMESLSDMIEHKILRSYKDSTFWILLIQ